MEPDHTTNQEDKKGTVIVLRMSAEDAERAMQAFKDGKLAELGITALDIAPEAESLGKWTQSQRAIEVKTSQDLLPPK